MVKAIFCRCTPRSDNMSFMTSWASGIEDIQVRYIVYRKPGHYDIKKYIERLYAPSSSSTPGDEGLHLCRRVFWCHIGLARAPIWFSWPHFPGWVRKDPTPILYRPDQLIGEFPPTITTAEEFNTRWRHLADLKEQLDAELKRVAEDMEANPDHTSF